MHANDGISSEAEYLSGLSGDVAAARRGTSTICRCSSCSHSSSHRQNGLTPMLPMMLDSESIELFGPDRGVIANKILGPDDQPERWSIVTRLKVKDEGAVGKCQNLRDASQSSMSEHD